MASDTKTFLPVLIFFFFVNKGVSDGTTFQIIWMPLRIATNNFTFRCTHTCNVQYSHLVDSVNQ